MSSPIVEIPLFVSPVFILAGLALLFFPPKKINSFYGYRTKRSMAGQEAWDYAQSRSGRFLIYFSLAFICTSLIDRFVDVPQNPAVFVSLGPMISGLVILFLKMERELKRKFGEEETKL